MSILRTMKVLVKKIRAALSAKLVPLVLAALLLPVLAGCGPKDIGAAPPRTASAALRPRQRRNSCAIP